MKKRLLIVALFLVRVISYGQTSSEELRQIVSAKAYGDGTLEWTSAGETSKAPYVIEQFRWNKWIKIGEVDPNLSQGQNVYQFKAIPCTGENSCRIKPVSSSNDFKEVKWVSNRPKVKFSIDKKASKIEFINEQSQQIETMYEIIDSSGIVVKKGWTKNVSYDNLPKGTYTLNYENTTTEFKK